MMAITIKSGKEIAVLREGGMRLAQVLGKIVEAVKPGISTWELDRLAESLIFEYGGAPAFKGYRVKETGIPYPGSLCVSINDEIVHAVPREDVILKEGDVVGIDIGMWWPKAIATSYQPQATSGFKKPEAGSRKPEVSLATDMAVTVGVGKISPDAEKLILATKEALYIGVKAVRPGGHVGDISYTIQKRLEKYNLGIIRDLAGHGVGYALHEEPLIPNFGRLGTGSELKEGMVLAIEPMATLGGGRVILGEDGWVFRTVDGSPAAHFEHTVAVTKDGAEVLTKL